jgi:hypothetical protein
MSLLWMRWFREQSGRLLVFAAALGAVAGAIKITTLFVFLALIGSWLLLSLVGRSTIKKAARTVALFALGALASAAPAVMWNRFADSVKSSGEFTVFLMSDSLRQWNFGTFAQRIDPDTWLQVYPWVLSIVGSPALLIFAVILLVLHMRPCRQRPAHFVPALGQLDRGYGLGGLLKIGRTGVLGIRKIQRGCPMLRE